jgi:protein subunit release factor A
VARRLDQLNARAEDPNLWQDPDAAQKVMRERNRLDNAIGEFRRLEQGLADNLELIDLAESEVDTAVVEEAEATLRAIRDRAAKKQLESLLSGEADANDCFLEVHAGAGGTESQDWAEMLSRMYLRWADRRGFKVEWIEESPGEEAGLKSATIRIEGDNAFGWLKTESGVHRLVRISPFDAQSRRHTSFASVSVYPVIDETIDVEINDKDPGPRGPADSTSTGPTARSASPTCRPASWCSARATARSTAIGPRPWPCCARGCTSRRCTSARPRPVPSTRPSRISAGATRSAPTSCTLIRW